jgi:hypothetical protein
MQRGGTERVRFLWFEPFLVAVAKHIGQKPGVRWIWEIESLGRKFDAIRSRDQRRRAKVLAK